MFFFQVFVALLDLGGGFGLEFLEKRKEEPWIEGFEGVIGLFTEGVAGCADEDDGYFWLQVFKCCNERIGWHIFHAGVHNDTVQCGKFAQGFDGFFAAVGGDDVELGGLDDEFAGGDAGGGFAIDDEVTGADHGSSIRSRRKINCSKRNLRVDISIGR